MNTFYVWMENFSKKEKKSASKSYENCGFTSSMPIKKIIDHVLKYLSKHPDASILDYGAGKHPIVANHLKDLKYDVTAHDFKINKKYNHDEDALERKYDLIFASGVLNVQKNKSMLNKSLEEMKDLLKSTGVLIANFPNHPKKLDVGKKEFIELVILHFPKTKFKNYKKQGLLFISNV